MSDQPSLSVLIPNYNHAPFLPAALDSILSQSYPATEVIVLDDASTDDSLEVLESFIRREPRLRVERNERNMGVVYTVNRLLELGIGDYIFMPSADDTVLPGFFEASMTLLARHPEAGLCSAVGRLMSEDGEDRGVRAIPVVSSKPCYLPPDEVRRMLCKYGRWIDAGSVIYRRDVLVLEGGQIEALGSYADTFINLVIALRYGACYVPQPLTSWRQMRGGYAASSNADWRELQRKGDLASELMRTRFRHLFPCDYVRRFERHWTYMVRSAAAQSARVERERALAETLHSLSSAPTWVKRGLLRLAHAFLAGHAAFRRLSYMAWYGPWRWWVLGRLSILRNLRTLAIFDRLET